MRIEPIYFCFTNDPTMRKILFNLYDLEWCHDEYVD